MNVLLPLCISLGVLGLVVAVLMWARGRRGRALQALAVGMLPFALYLIGLLPLVWSGIVEVARWVGGLVFNPAVWAGVGVLGLSVVLWVVGSMVGRRTRGRAKSAEVKSGQGSKAVPSGKPASKPAKQAKSAPASSGDDELDEIEALLRQRGIE